MPVSNQTARTSVVGTNTIGQEIPFSFPIKATSDLSCFQRITATGVQTSLAETTNYTVVIDGDNGGTITLVTVVATSAEFHAIRNTPMTQTLDLEQGDDFSGPNLENAFDKNTRLIIENADATENKALTIPETDASSLTTVLPNSIDRASKVCSFDSNGSVTAITAVPTGSVAFTTFGENMVGAANALAGKVVMNIDHFHDIRDYGAVSGAGDVTSEIQDAMDAAVAGTGSVGTVFVPDGTWNCSTELTVAGGTSVNLIGPSYVGGNAILNYSGTGTFLSLNSGFNLVKNLKFQGPTTSSATSEIGLLLGVSGDPKRENIVRQCWFTGWNTAIKSFGTYALIDHCEIDTFYTTGYEHASGVEPKVIDTFFVGEAGSNCVTLSTSRFARFEGNTFSSAARGMNATSANILMLINNHFEGLTEFSILNADGSATTTMIGNRIEGNVRLGSAEATLIDNFFTGTFAITQSAGNSNWTMINNVNLVPSSFTGTVGNLNWLDQNRLGLVAFTDADETPDVNGGNRYSTNNSSAGNITDFDKGWAGQVITILGNDSGNTKIINASGKIGLKDRKDFTLLDGDVVSFMYNGTDWWETSRSHNTSSSVANIVCVNNQVVCVDNEVVIN